MLAVFRKEPGAKLDFGIDWTAWLKGDTISSATWTVADGITRSSFPAPSVENDGTLAVAWFEGGTHGGRYAGRCQITTAAGRVEGQDFEVRVHNDG